MEDFLADILVYLGIINVGERTIGSSLFKQGFFELLPKNFSTDEKEAFYQELKKKEFIISEKNITVVKYSGDLFNYKKEKEFFDYLDKKFEHDKDTIDKIKKYYNNNNNKDIFTSGGKKHKKNNKKHKTQKRKTIKKHRKIK